MWVVRLAATVAGTGTRVWVVRLAATVAGGASRRLGSPVIVEGSIVMIEGSLVETELGRLTGDGGADVLRHFF